MRKKKKY